MSYSIILCVTSATTQFRSREITSRSARDTGWQDMHKNQVRLGNTESGLGVVKIRFPSTQFLAQAAQNLL